MQQILKDETTTAMTVSGGPRPPPLPVSAMAFWDTIFPSAMTRFKSQHPYEPKGRDASGHSIRTMTDWDDVYGALQNARESYESPKGLRGSFRKGVRKAAAKGHQPLHSAVGFVPEIDYVKPVLGALEIIAKVRPTFSQQQKCVLNYLHCLIHFVCTRLPREPRR